MLDASTRFDGREPIRTNLFFRQLVRPGLRECDKERHVKTPFRFCLEIILLKHINFFFSVSILLESESHKYTHVIGTSMSLIRIHALFL